MKPHMDELGNDQKQGNKKRADSHAYVELFELALNISRFDHTLRAKANPSGARKIHPPLLREKCHSESEFMPHRTASVRTRSLLDDLFSSSVLSSSSGFEGLGVRVSGVSGLGFRWFRVSRV
eukprot:3416294-Amphidinium_carterae.2